MIQISETSRRLLRALRWRGVANIDLRYDQRGIDWPPSLACGQRFPLFLRGTASRFDVAVLTATPTALKVTRSALNVANHFSSRPIWIKWYSYRSYCAEDEECDGKISLFTSSANFSTPPDI